MDDKCKFCERFREEIKIDEEKGITVQNMYDIMKLSIETLNNANCNVECWLNGDIFLGKDFHIGHFNAIPDITFSFDNEEIKDLEQQLSQLQQENQKLNDSINQSNLAKISALLKLEKLQQEKEELIKWLEHLVTIGYTYCDRLGSSKTAPERIRVEAYEEILSKLKESDKNEC